MSLVNVVLSNDDLYKLVCRLTPPLIALIILDIFVLPYTVTGALVKTFVKYDKCVSNWWYTLFYINNYIPAEAKVSTSD